MTSARRWLSDNADTKCTKVKFTEEVALNFCRDTIATPVGEHNHCSCDNGVCAVCLDEMESGSIVQMKNCGHFFHEGCLATWFVQSSRLQCPMCRADHHSCVPQEQITLHTVKEEPTVSVVSVVIEEGTLSSGQ